VEQEDLAVQDLVAVVHPNRQELETQVVVAELGMATCLIHILVDLE
tara:strand:+ start:353 stop:490 length:138 start_codon:yes stop_codon:yes gene_type:complete